MQVMTLAYNSNGSLSYIEACILSSEERSEWIKYIQGLHSDDDATFTQEMI